MARISDICVLESAEPKWDSTWWHFMRFQSLWTIEKCEDIKCGINLSEIWNMKYEMNETEDWLTYRGPEIDMLLTSICFFSRHESSCSEVRTGWELDDQGGMNMLAYICIVFETSILISTRCYRLKPTEFFFFHLFTFWELDGFTLARKVAIEWQSDTEWSSVGMKVLWTQLHRSQRPKLLKAQSKIAKQFLKGIAIPESIFRRQPRWLRFQDSTPQRNLRRTGISWFLMLMPRGAML